MTITGKPSFAEWQVSHYIYPWTLIHIQREIINAIPKLTKAINESGVIIERTRAAFVPIVDFLKEQKGEL